MSRTEFKINPFREKEEKTETENPKDTDYLLDPAMTEARPAWAFKFHESALSQFC